MKRLHVKFIKWLANKFGYKIAMLKASNGTTIIEGDNELLKYTDISGYFFKKEPLKRVIPKVMENINNELKEIFVQMTAQQVYNKYIKPMSDSSEYTLPETGAMLFYAKKHPEGCNIDKITFTSLDEDYCVSLIKSVMDSEGFLGWPFGDKKPIN
jgi:hypothetical protein